MDWIKVPVDFLLYPEFSEKESLILLRYQALFGLLEMEPTTRQMEGVFTPKQIEFLRKNNQFLSEIIKNSVESLKKKRGRDKNNYKRKQSVIENSASGTPANRQLFAPPDKIREEKILESKDSNILSYLS